MHSLINSLQARYMSNFNQKIADCTTMQSGLLTLVKNKENDCLQDHILHAGCTSCESLFAVPNFAKQVLPEMHHLGLFERRMETVADHSNRNMWQNNSPMKKQMHTNNLRVNSDPVKYLIKPIEQSYFNSVKDKDNL